MGGWTAATEVQQEMFLHLALMSVELANSFWPRKLRAAPIGFSFQRKTLFEHLILWLEVVDEEEAVGLSSRLFVDPVQLVLRQQGAQLFDDGVQLVLVAQPPAAEKLLIDPHGCADEPQLLGAHPGAYLQVPTPDEERIQGAVRFVKLWAICEVVADYKHPIQLLHLQLLGCLGDLALPLDDVPQRCLVPLVVVGPLPFGIHPQVLLYVLLDGDPAVVDIDGRTEDIDFLEDSAVLLHNHADQRHGFAGLAGAEEDTCACTRGTTGSEGCLLLYSAVGNSLIFPISFALLPKFDAGKPGSETEINLKAGMRVKCMGSKSWLAPHVDRLLGDVAVLHSPFFGSGKLEYYIATRRGPEGARRRRLRARRKPAPLLLEARPGLPALLAAPGGAQSRQALLLQSPPAGHSERPRRAPGCLLVRPAAQQLLKKVGLLHTAAPAGAEQRAAYAAASAQCDRAAPGRTNLSALCPVRHPDRPYMPILPTSSQAAA